MREQERVLGPGVSGDDLAAIKVQAEKPYGSVDERYLRDWLLDVVKALEEARRLFTEYGNHHSSCILGHHAPGVRDCGCGFIAALRTILGESK